MKHFEEQKVMFSDKCKDLKVDPEKSIGYLCWYFFITGCSLGHEQGMTKYRILQEKIEQEEANDLPI